MKVVIGLTVAIWLVFFSLGCTRDSFYHGMGAWLRGMSEIKNQELGANPTIRPSIQGGTDALGGKTEKEDDLRPLY